jgi:pimeloyl-ACP methyl ester carboxylesterase
MQSLMHTYTRTDIKFSSGDSFCAGWLYRPTAVQRPPMVILGHGLGAVREMRLDAYAERFAAAGLAALVFTYRHFGDSGGWPRQLVSVRHQLADWHAAVDCAQTLDGVDTGRIALWGTSFGGGHVLTIAARRRDIAAAVAQCPFTDGVASGLAVDHRTTLKVVTAALRDLFGQLRRGEPTQIPLAGPPGSAALMTAPDALPGMQALVDDHTPFVNAVAARAVFQILTYRPGRATRAIAVPILFCVSEHDSVAPTKTTVRRARRAPKGTILVDPAGHFELYHDEAFERLVQAQTSFLLRSLTESDDQ